MAAAKRTVRLGALRRTTGPRTGQAVRSLRNVRVLPRGTDARPGNRVGTRGAFGGGRVASRKGNVAQDLIRKGAGNLIRSQPLGRTGARRLNRALLGALTSPYRFRRPGRVGARQG